MVSKNIIAYLYCALYFTISPQLTGCDRDPETGEKIITTETSKDSTEKYSFRTIIQ